MTDTFFPMIPFPRLEPGALPLATWDDLTALYRPYSEIWEAEGMWLMGRSVLQQIVEHWRHHLPAPANRVHDEVMIEFQYPVVRDEVSGVLMSIVHAIPSELLGILGTRVSEVANFRWPSWEPALQLLVGEPANALSAARVSEVIRATEHRALALGHPELWQIAAAAFGIPMRIGGGC